jgi:hypothetical protein
VRDVESLVSLWPAVIELVRGENAMLAAVIADSRPVAAEGDDLILAFAASAPFLKKKAENADNRMIVGEALRSVTGVRWRLSYELRETPADQSQEVAGGATSEEEWVKRVIDEFDAEELADWDQDGSGEGAPEAGTARAITSNEGGA